jgi:hypothetical protein
VIGLILLFVVAPLVGALPGPGGIVVAGIGLAMVLKTSAWAKRRYVRFKRWQPKAGGWTDWALRRQSARRRLKLQKEREAQGLPLLEEEEGSADALVAEQPLAPPEAMGRPRRARTSRPERQLTSALPSLIGPLQQRLPKRRPFFL